MKPTENCNAAASAGGLEAVTELLEHLPERTGMAFVLVQHLDPHHHSLLSEFLGRRTKLPVREASENTRVLPDRIYVIPPNKNMTLEKGALRLAARTLQRGQHMPVDIFLRSLALDCGDRGCVDFVLPPSAIAWELTRIDQHPYVRVKPATAPDVREAEAVLEPAEKGGTQKPEGTELVGAQQGKSPRIKDFQRILRPRIWSFAVMPRPLTKASL